MNYGRNMLQARLFRNLDKPGLKEGFKTRVLLTLQQTLILNSFVLQEPVSEHIMQHKFFYTLNYFNEENFYQPPVPLCM